MGTRRLPAGYFDTFRPCGYVRRYARLSHARRRRRTIVVYERKGKTRKRTAVDYRGFNRYDSFLMRDDTVHIRLLFRVRSDAGFLDRLSLGDTDKRAVFMELQPQMAQKQVAIDDSFVNTSVVASALYLPAIRQLQVMAYIYTRRTDGNYNRSVEQSDQIQIKFFGGFI